MAEDGFVAFAERVLSTGLLKRTNRNADPINSRIVAKAAERRPKDIFLIIKG